MTRQEKRWLQADRDFLYQYALQFQTLERQITEREKQIAEYDSEASRLAKEVRELQRTLRQLEVKFGNCLAQFTFDYERGTFINSNRFL